MYHTSTIRFHPQVFKISTDFQIVDNKNKDGYPALTCPTLLQVHVLFVTNLLLKI